MTGLAKTSEIRASHLAANDLPHERLALELARRQFGFAVFSFADRVRCGKYKLVLVCNYKSV
eukprot:6214206-Pleurochrysis_carterae.AAC.3